MVDLIPTIKGEIAADVESNFRKRIAERLGTQKGNISKALEQAILLWLQSTAEDDIARFERYQKLKELQQEFSEKFLILNPESFEVVGKGEDLVSATQMALSKHSTLEKYQVVKKNQILVPHRVQLPWRLRLKSYVPSTEDT